MRFWSSVVGSKNVSANILSRGLNCCIASFFVVLLRDVFYLWREMGSMHPSLRTSITSLSRFSCVVVSPGRLFRTEEPDVSDVSVSLSFRERFFV